MGVTRPIDNISLTASSSQLEGGQVSDNQAAQMSAPGSWGAAPAPVPEQVGPQHVPPSFGSGSDVSEEIVTDAGAALGHDFLPAGVARGPDGRWKQVVTEDSGQPEWRPTPSSGG